MALSRLKQLLTFPRADINAILTANELQNITEIRDDDGDIGITATGVRNNVLYFVVTGIENNEHGIPVTAILRVTTSGTGSSRTFTLDTGYCKIVGIHSGVEGLLPTEGWILAFY